MQDNINEVFAKALTIKKDKIVDKISNLTEFIEKAIFSNKELILQANQIDTENNNGFIIDFDVVSSIFANLKKETNIYGSVILSQKDDQKQIIYGKQLMDYGNVIVINDGNPYTIIELAVRNLLAANSTIFTNSGYMFGSNKLIIQIIQSVLEKNDISPNFIQIYIDENYSNILSNFANIDLVICVGNHQLQQEVLTKSRNKTIVSGYEEFDLYIEDKTNIDFLNKILNIGLKLQLYIKADLNIDYKNAIIVSDVDEAIAQINYNGSKYSSAIFTNSTENASIFVKEVKSSIVTINTSPSIERIIDINQSDISKIKTIIYPNGFKNNQKFNLKFKIGE